MKRKQRDFLRAYAASGRFCEAGRAAKCHPTNHYNWMKNDPEYEAAFRQAEEEAIVVLEDEVRRRAEQGVDEPVVYQGKYSYERIRVGKKYVKKPVAINRKSDILAMFLLKKMRPDKYRDTAKVELEISGSLIAALNEGRKRLMEENERSDRDNIAGS